MYSNYENMSVDQFLVQRDKIGKIKELIVSHMLKHDFHLSDRYADEYLTASFSYENQSEFGNIGFNLVDEENPYYKVYVLKGRDENGFRYFKRIPLKKIFPDKIDEVDWMEVFDKALEVYGKISESEYDEAVKIE